MHDQHFFLQITQIFIFIILLSRNITTSRLYCVVFLTDIFLWQIIKFFIYYLLFCYVGTLQHLTHITLFLWPTFILEDN